MMKKLFVLDGSGYVFRAYYGLPPLHDTDGHNVNAIFGFFRMLFKLRQDKPDYFMIARDAPVKTVRKELDDTYKANRVKMPDEFKRQMGMIKELVGQLQIPAEEIPGFEADDIIGTIADMSRSCANWSQLGVQIVSSDKDLKQLVRSGQVTMFDAMKNILTTEESFLEEFGFAPALMVDYLALVGDSADNIKGVPGIGKVTALKLVQERGDMDSIYAHLDEIGGSVAQKLRDGKEAAYHSKSLTQIMEVPGYDERDPEAWTCMPDFDHLKHTLSEGFGFHSLDKVVDETKKQRQAGEQLSLFG